VVQHKQSRDLYALKYINKAKCVKMKAVANIVQERRLLEEVRRRTHSCAFPNIPLFFVGPRSTIPLLSTCATLSRMTRTAFSSSTLCLVAISAVRVSHYPPSPAAPIVALHSPTVHLERLGSLSEDTVRFYSAELASALAFLHEKRIMHRFARYFRCQ
jgi:serine/threonine kinase 32